MHGAAFAAALLLSTGLLLQKAAAATTLTLTWQASASSPNIDGYRVYYGTSSRNYSQHADFLGTGTSVTVVAPPAGSTYYYMTVAYKGNLESSDSNEVTKSTPAASPTPTPTPTPLYDFNGDGEPDYLLYNVSTRQTAVWYLNNNAFVAGTYAPTLPAGWRVVGVADFNGDSQPDYLLFNASTRQTAIWYLSGATFIGGAYGPSLPSGWELVTVSDFNADNKPDYLLYNAGTRQTAIWYPKQQYAYGWRFCSNASS